MRSILLLITLSILCFSTFSYGATIESNTVETEKSINFDGSGNLPELNIVFSNDFVIFESLTVKLSKQEYQMPKKFKIMKAYAYVRDLSKLESEYMQYLS